MKFDISNIGTWAGSLSLLAWVVYIVFKCFVQESMKSKFAKELQNLKDKNQSELEAFKAGYQKVLDENQIRFSWYYSEQAQVIRELYKRLVNLRKELIILTEPLKSMSKEEHENQEKFYRKLLTAAAEAYNECSSYFLENEILLPKDLCNTLNSFMTESRQAFLDYSFTIEYPAERPEHYANIFKERTAAYKSAKETLPKILEKLKIDFRAILNGEEVMNDK